MGFGGGAPKAQEPPAAPPKEKPKQKARGGYFGPGVSPNAEATLNSVNTRRGAFLGA